MPVIKIKLILTKFEYRVLGSYSPLVILSCLLQCKTITLAISSLYVKYYSFLCVFGICQLDKSPAVLGKAPFSQFGYWVMGVLRDCKPERRMVEAPSLERMISVVVCNACLLYTSRCV